MAGAKLSRHWLEENGEAVDDAEDGEHRDEGGGDYDPGCTALLVVIHSVDSATLARVLGTGLAYVLNFGVIRAAGATAASTVTYVIPLFPTGAGVLLPGERLSWYEPLGGLVVIVGVAVSQGGLRAFTARLSPLL